LAAGLFVVLGAGVLVRVVLGPRWSSVTPIIRQLGLAVPVQIIISSAGSFYQAMKRPDLLLVTSLYSSIPVISAIAVGIWQRDLVLMSWLLSVSFNIGFFICYFVLYKYVFRVSPWVFYSRLRVQILANLLILGVGSPLMLRFFSSLAFR
jgi:PST family polysaccharide transporter